MPMPSSPLLQKSRSSNTVAVGDVNHQFAHISPVEGERINGVITPIRTIGVSAIAPSLGHQLHQSTLSFRDRTATHDTGRGTHHHHQPPAKRRKLADHGQTTLDKHFFPASHNTLSRHQSQQSPTITVTPARTHTFDTVTNLRSATTRPAENLPLKSAPNALARSVSRVSRSPAPAPTPPPEKSEDKRTLRSQDDGPRLKSELAIYFPNYEDIIFDAPKDEEFITVDSTLYLTDDTPKQQDADTASPGKTNKPKGNSKGRTSLDPPATPRSNSWNTFNGSPSLDLDFMTHTASDCPDDPLSDAHFFKSHRRAERRERQLRNIERERAMHEKVQLDRLLDGLLGHDWLRVLGITGITDGEARRFEPKRDYFIAEVRALVDKFRLWKEEEKRQRLEKEAAAHRDAEASDEEEAEDAHDDDDNEDEDEDDDSPEGSINPPSSDLNASASRQLQQETLRASRTASKPRPRSNAGNRASPFLIDTPTAAARRHPPHHNHSATASPSQPALPPSPEVPITSFYAKRHLRDAALGRSRHGRSVTAFGRPLPEMEPVEFCLPEDYVTADTLRANARERRRRKRETLSSSAG